MKLITEITTLDHPVKLERTARGRYRVTYGQQVKDRLTYSEAAKEFGLCVMHSAECAGKLDEP